MSIEFCTLRILKQLLPRLEIKNGEKADIVRIHRPEGLYV